MTEIEEIIAEAATLPLRDAAFALWRQRPRLDALEGRPTPEEVRVNRAMSPEQLSAKLRYDRDHAQDGPTFDRLKRAHPQADDADIERAVIAAVEFDDDCFKYFSYDGDYCDNVVRAVALAAKNSPFYLESTYQAARNHVAYHMK